MMSSMNTKLLGIAQAFAELSQRFSPTSEARYGAEEISRRLLEHATLPADPIVTVGVGVLRAHTP